MIFLSLPLRCPQADVQIFHSTVVLNHFILQMRGLMANQGQEKD